MNLKLHLPSIVFAVFASFLLHAEIVAQQSMIPTAAVPYGQAGMPQIAAQRPTQHVPYVHPSHQQQGGFNQASLNQASLNQARFNQPRINQPSFNQPQARQVGFTEYMGQQNQAIASWADYTPELISTYSTNHNCSTARKIGVATVTDYALGQGRHSPLTQDVAQASYFQPVARQSAVGAYDVSPNSGFGAYSPTSSAPQFFGGSNIGGGRSIATAFMDPHWTRMVLVYGGFGNSADSGGDVFGGQASADLGVVGIDIGRRHSKFMRSSIDFTYRGGDVDFAGANVGDVNVYSLMKNFHLDLAQRGQLRPYIGVGLGAGVLDADANFGGSTFSVQDEVSFAFQVMGGAAYNISDLAAIYAEYRFFSMSDVDVSTGAGTSEGNFASHDVLFGLRFGF